MLRFNESVKKKNELTHWKYIKKEKKNGKWRYYYDINALKNDVNDLKNDINDKLGINAKKQMEQDGQRLNDTKKELQQLERLLVNNKISRSEYEKKINELSKLQSVAEENAGFDRDIQKEYRDHLYEKYSDNYMNIPKKDLEGYKTVSSRAEKSEAQADAIRKSKDNYIRLMNNKNGDIFKTESYIRGKKSAINQLKSSYMTNKNIYDKSIVGYIDKGKQNIEKLLKKLRG